MSSQVREKVLHIRSDTNSKQLNLNKAVQLNSMGVGVVKLRLASYSDFKPYRKAQIIMVNEIGKILKLSHYPFLYPIELDLRNEVIRSRQE